MLCKVHFSHLAEKGLRAPLGLCKVRCRWGLRAARLSTFEQVTVGSSKGEVPVLWSRQDPKRLV